MLDTFTRAPYVASALGAQWTAARHVKYGGVQSTAHAGFATGMYMAVSTGSSCLNLPHDVLCLVIKKFHTCRELSFQGYVHGIMTSTRT